MLKCLGDISHKCQICFVKDGQIHAGFSLESVQSNRRGADCLTDGIYEVYISYLGEHCSNVIKYERQGDRFIVLE